MPPWAALWFVKPLLYLAALAVICAGLWWLHHSIDAAGYDRGKAEVTADYAKRDAKATAAANDRIRTLELAARAKERESATQVAEISSKYQSEVVNANAKVADLSRRVAAGTVRLFDPARSATASCERAAAETGPSAQRRDGGAPSDVPEPSAGVLSVSASQFLIALAGECDAVATQLGAAQAVIRADRK